MAKELGVTNSQSIHFIAPKKRSKIAYFILVHSFPKQFKRLFKAIYHPENHYLIHIDQKTDSIIKEDIKFFLEDYSNAYFLRNTIIDSGKYNMVQSQLNGMKYLLNRCLKWDFFINLSGQDFPLKSQDLILDFLQRNKGKNFINIMSQVRERANTLDHVENYFQNLDIGFSGIPYKRSFMKNVTPYVGEQWMILNRACCEFICHSPEVKKFEDFYRKKLTSNESFFQTLLMNTLFKETIINDGKRAVIYISNRDIKFKSKTLTGSDIDFLMHGNKLFARKFDEAVDESILNTLEQALKIDDKRTKTSKNIDVEIVSTRTVDKIKSDRLDSDAVINSLIKQNKQLLNGSK